MSNLSLSSIIERELRANPLLELMIAIWLAVGAVVTPFLVPIWVLWLLVFALLYKVATMSAPPYNRPEFASRIVSGVHAAIVGIPAARAWATGDTSAMESVCAVSIGYLIHDLIVITREANLRHAGTYVHHALFLTLLFLFGPAEPYLAAMGLTTELSLIPLHVGWAMAKLRCARDWKYTAVGAVVFFSFAARVAVFVAMLPLVKDTAALAGLSIIVGFNVHWMVLIAKKVVGAIVGGGSDVRVDD